MNRPANPAEVAVASQAARSEWEALRLAHPEIAFIDAAIADICGTLRGKRFAADEAAKLFESGMQIPLSLHLMDVRGEMMNPGGRGYSDGDPDGTAWPIAGTVMPLWGSDPPRAQVLMELYDPSGAALFYEPRAILARVLSQFEELKLTPVTAVELEFYLIDPKRDAQGRPQPPVAPATGARESALSVYGLDDLDRFQDFLSALNAAASAERVPVTAASKEYAPGQFEANLRHQSDALAAADHAILLRQIIRAAAESQGFGATFMSKPYPARSGSGQHVHVNLIDEAERNVFEEGRPGADTLLRHAIGGMAAMMPESMAFFAANVNAYRRFQPDMFAPVNRRWGFNNRSVGLRVPLGAADSRRIEHRAAGADANPYLVMAAVLAGAHFGIVNEIDPGDPAAGNVSREPDPAMPFTLERALEMLEHATMLRGYFGAEAVALYSATKAEELARFRKLISTEEYEWYL
jgi:glutamine synthetase